MAELNRIGAKVTQIRESRKISRQELAERSELDTKLIDRIETGELIPSLSPLIKIARVLGVRLGTFLDDQEHIGPVLTRTGDRPKRVGFAEKRQAGRADLDFYALAADKTGRHMEPFVIDIHPLSDREIVLSAHEGEEFIYVLSGTVEISYGRETYMLEEGDSIYYDSIVSHNVHCKDGGDARILAVVYTPF
jgi:transcriptional regulator with XRE-family HTH domain